jgi:putative lipoprotein
MTRRRLVSDTLVVGILLGAVHCRPAPEKTPPNAEVSPSIDTVSQNTQAGLGGTSWRLVKFQGGDETTLTPDDPAKYTIAFETDGRLRARIDCNRGMGTWKSSAPPQLEFGPLALTRALCPPGSLHDQLVRQWPYVRSYVMRDGHLFLSLMADGGIYEFEPMSGEQGMKRAVRGTATYRERIAMPPGAVFEATSQDVSRADAPAVVTGRAHLENPGNPPIKFEIPYDPSTIDSRRSYAVRARITVDGTLFFTTDQHYPVLTAGKGTEVQLLLKKAASLSQTTVSLENTYWKLTHLGDDIVTVASQQPEPHLILNSGTGRATGSGGCNRMTGSYQLTGDRLSLGQMVSTMMACMEGMETEQAFLKALGQVNRWSITGRQLELKDAAGRVLARFDGRHMG